MKLFAFMSTQDISKTPGQAGPAKIFLGRAFFHGAVCSAAASTRSFLQKRFRDFRTQGSRKESAMNFYAANMAALRRIWKNGNETLWVHAICSEDSLGDGPAALDGAVVLDLHILSLGGKNAALIRAKCLLQPRIKILKKFCQKY